jgi:hypothetical protein
MLGEHFIDVRKLFADVEFYRRNDCRFRHDEAPFPIGR